MKFFKLTFIIEDEIAADSKDAAWELVKKRIQDGYYGPTRDNLEPIEGIEPFTADSPS